MASSEMMAEGNAVRDSAASQAINQLGVHLLTILGEKEGNVFFSPLSLSTALTMTYMGAQNETAEEMRSVLGYNVADDVKSYFQELLVSLDNKTDSYTLNMANAVFIEQSFSAKKEFKNSLEEFFAAKIFETDLGKAVQEINQWAEHKTNGMIPQLLESMDKSHIMILLNAVYFKGLWKNPFQEKSTFLQYFYNNGVENNANLVEMMHLKEKFFYVETEHYQAIDLPYVCEDIVMSILLPKVRDGLRGIENLVTADFIKSLKSNMAELKIEVALPKFRLEYSETMNEFFQKLGMNSAFNPDADFRGISDIEAIFISDIIHKAVFEVDEKGSTAAALTAIRMCRAAILNCPEFIVDHPFVFWIKNCKTEVVLFMGKVDEIIPSS